jgi:hypothetical protein
MANHRPHTLADVCAYHHREQVHDLVNFAFTNASMKDGFRLACFERFVTAFRNQGNKQSYLWIDARQACRRSNAEVHGGRDIERGDAQLMFGSC